ncbi:hypothetical protein F4677DRAFT_43843 [Hypoxylon crocopeplum]|nr:hypothetical protein F4677DRAFT_43843 [Hypoxylon crocopeplum]
MAGFTSWLSFGTPKRSAESHGNLQTNKVIHGRVTKPVSSATGNPYEESFASADKSGGIGGLAMTVRAGSKPGVGKKENEKENEDDASSSDDSHLSDPPHPPFPSVPLSSSEDNSDLDNEPPPTSSSSEETNADYDLDEGWRHEQVFLNQILKARNEYTLMPSTWRMHFRGIPLPDGLFYIQNQTSSFRPRIYARNPRLEYQGAVALRRLIDMHTRVHDLRKAHKLHPDHGYGGRIVEQISGRLRGALHWAEFDGDINKYSNHLPNNVTVMVMGESSKLDMDLRIQSKMENLTAEWQDVLEKVPEQDRPQAPVLFGFVIFKHILFIVTIDGSNPDAICHIPCQLNLSERTQHQWNALAIMVTICWARDLLAGIVTRIPGIDLSSEPRPLPPGRRPKRRRQDESDPDA